MANLSGVGSIASAGVGLLGNIIGGISQRKTNQMNLKINQMNNEFNERMMREQMAWEEEMWNKQNAYNTPLAMKQRYREAGLNAGLMFSENGAAGVAGSVGNASSASASGNSQMQPFRPDMSSVVAGLTSFDQLMFKNEYQQALTRNMELQNKYFGAKAQAEIDQIIEDTRNTKAKRLYQETENLFAKDIFDSTVKQMKENRLLTQRQAENELARNVLLNLQIDQQKTYLKYYPQELVNNLAIQASIIKKNEKDLEVADAKIANLAADTAKKYAEENGIKLNNEVLEDTKEQLIKATNEANKQLEKYHSHGSGDLRYDSELYDSHIKRNESIRGAASMDDWDYYRGAHKKKAVFDWP